MNKLKISSSKWLVSLTITEREEWDYHWEVVKANTTSQEVTLRKQNKNVVKQVSESISRSNISIICSDYVSRAILLPIGGKVVCDYICVGSMILFFMTFDSLMWVRVWIIYHLCEAYLFKLLQCGTENKNHLGRAMQVKCFVVLM